MDARSAGWIAPALAASLLTLGGCDNAPGPDPGRQDIALATQALDNQLNLPAEQMRRALAIASADKHIYPWELLINAPTGPVAVDWWLYDHGYIRVGGVTAYQGYFVLTPKGDAFVKGGSPRWLVSSFKGAPQITCGGTKAYERCQVIASATVAVSPDVKDLEADPQSVPAQSFQVVLQEEAGAWSTDDFASSTTPADAGRRALFGDDRTIGKARARYAVEVNRQVH